MTDFASRASGLHGSTYVPLTVPEFQRAYAEFRAVLNGDKPGRPDFPAVIQDAATGNVVPFPDTRFNQAWYAAGMMIEDDAKRVSFGKRVEMMTEFVSGKYAKYVDLGAEAMHVALMATIAQVPFCARTTKKALRAAFATEFRRQLARVIDADQPQDQQRH